MNIFVLLKNFIVRHLDSLFISCVIFFVGCYLFFTLSVNPLDIDELYTINILSLNNIFEIIRIGNIFDNHPPLFHIIMYVFTQIFGVSEYIIRIPSVIFFLISIYLSFILVKKLFSTTDAIVSIIIMIILFPHPWVSQYARGYSLLLMFTLITMLMFVDILKYKQNNINKNISFNLFISYITVSLCCMYSHYFGCIIIFTELLFLVIIFGKKIVRELVYIFIIIAIFYLPWLLLILPKQIRRGPPNFIEWINWNVFGDYNAIILFILIFLALIPIIHEIIKYRNIKFAINNNMSVFAVLFLFLFPYLFVYLLYILGITCYQSKYLIISIIPFYVLIARGINIVKRKSIIFLLVVIFVLSALWQKQHFIPFLDNPEYIINFVINNHNKTKRPILFINNKVDMFREYYQYHFDKYLKKDINNSVKIVFDYDNYHNINNDIKMLSRIYNNQYIWVIDCTMTYDVNRFLDTKNIVKFNDKLPQIYLIKNKL